MNKFLTFLAVFLTISGCFFTSKSVIKGKGDIKLTEVDFEDLDNFEDADFRQSLFSFLNSCEKFKKLPQNRLIGGQIGEIYASDYRDVCEIGEVVKGLSDAQIANFFKNWFRPFLVSNRKGKSKGLFTGYYEASLNGSKYKSAKYKYPIYKRPRDLKSDELYYSRQEIEEGGVLNNKNLEILYVDDEVELFFAHIQGSARVNLPSGAVLRISYDGKNNQPFSPTSRFLLDNNYLSKSEISAENIKKWLKNNPEIARKAMNYNQSFIFFKISNEKFVKGGQGVELTPQHSLAVDKNIIPYGTILWLETSLNSQKFNRLMVAQDTGSAIKGVIRGDVFFGYGDEAQHYASSMANFGQYYAILPINIIERLKNNNNVKKSRW